MADIRADIRSQVEAAIAPWQSSKDKPPFSAKQLIAIALLSRDTPLTQEEIYTWIITNFRYYSHLMVYAFKTYEIEGSCSPRCNRDYPADEMDEIIGFHRQIFYAFKSIDTPIQIEETPNGLRFTILATNAECLLSTTLKMGKTDWTGCFRLMDLPAELRQYIFELVFAYPRSGLAVIEHEDDLDIYKDFRAFANGFDKDFSFAEWANPKIPSMREWELDEIDAEPQLPYMVWTERVSKILTPLLVNHQFFEEAMPVFYSLNHFYCPRITCLEEFLIRAPVARRNHIGKISTRYLYDYNDVHAAANAFKLLGQIKHLQTFHLHIDNQWGREIDTLKRSSDDGLIEIFYDDDSDKADRVSCAAYFGLDQLRSVKAEDLRVEGCSAMEEILKEEMAKSEVPSETTNKRTASDEDESELAGDKHAKKAKTS